MKERNYRKNQQNRPSINDPLYFLHFPNRDRSDLYVATRTRAIRAVLVFSRIREPKEIRTFLLILKALFNWRGSPELRVHAVSTLHQLGNLRCRGVTSCAIIMQGECNGSSMNSSAAEVRMILSQRMSRRTQPCSRI